VALVWDRFARADWATTARTAVTVSESNRSQTGTKQILFWTSMWAIRGVKECNIIQSAAIRFIRLRYYVPYSVQHVPMYVHGSINHVVLRIAYRISS
jgi:hypothetical protein